MCVFDGGAGARGDEWRGYFLSYRVCTIKSPERRREERRRRREKALPLSAELSIAAREEKEERVQFAGHGAGERAKELFINPLLRFCMKTLLSS